MHNTYWHIAFKSIPHLIVYLIVLFNLLMLVQYEHLYTVNTVMSISLFVVFTLSSYEGEDET